MYIYIILTENTNYIFGKSIHWLVGTCVILNSAKFVGFQTERWITGHSSICFTNHVGSHFLGSFAKMNSIESEWGINLFVKGTS